MRPTEFFAAIENTPLRPLYYFYGNDTYLRQKATQCVIDLWGEEISRGINFEVYSGASSSLPVVIDNARTAPFFGDRKVILVKDPAKLSSTDEETFLSYAKNPNPKTILIFSGGSFGLKKKSLSLVKKHGLVAECKQPYSNNVPAWIQFMARNLGKSMGGPAAHLFQEVVGNRLQDLANELEKLSLYVGESTEITREAIEAAVSSLRVESIFELTDRVGNSKGAEALIALSQLMRSGEPPLKILAMITRQFRQLTKARFLLDQGMRPEEIKRALKIQDFIWRKLSPQAKRFSREKLGKCFQLLLQADLSLKSQSIPDKIILERLVLDLCA